MEHFQAAYEPAPDSSQAPRQPAQRMRFHATGGDYFRIWIVNLLLTIATLGIYAAWAKVRRNQYLYSNTELAGSSFEYHGNPIAILKGRIIALLIFGGYNLALRVSPKAGLAMLVVVMLVMPWLVWNSLKFQLHNASYRGIRFGFDGTLFDAYQYYLLLPLLNVVTVLLAAPFVHQRLKRFQHSQSRYGTQRFSFDATPGDFYRSYGVFLLIVLAGVALVVGSQYVFVTAAGISGGAQTVKGMSARFMFVFLGVYVWMFLVFPLFLNMIQNLIWNHTAIGPHRFESDMKWGRLTFITVTNFFAIVFTLGLFTPFARIRSMRYRIECMSLLPQGSLGDFTASADGSVSATGVGATDLMDFDLSM